MIIQMWRFGDFEMGRPQCMTRVQIHRCTVSTASEYDGCAMVRPQYIRCGRQGRNEEAHIKPEGDIVGTYLSRYMLVHIPLIVRFIVHSSFTNSNIR